MTEASNLRKNDGAHEQECKCESETKKQIEASLSFGG